MEKLLYALQYYFVNDGRCLAGVIVSALFCAWLVWTQEMRREVQSDGKYWWLAPLGEVAVAFVLGALFWPLGLVLLAACVMLLALDAAPSLVRKRPSKT